MTNELEGKAKITATLFSIQNSSDCDIVRGVMKRVERKHNIKLNEIVFSNASEIEMYGLNVCPTVLLDIYSIEGRHANSMYINMVEELNKWR